MGILRSNFSLPNDMVRLAPSYFKDVFPNLEIYLGKSSLTMTRKQFIRLADWLQVEAPHYEFIEIDVIFKDEVEITPYLDGFNPALLIERDGNVFQTEWMEKNS